MFSGLVVWLFGGLVMSRADARDTGAALIIWAEGALGQHGRRSAWRRNASARGGIGGGGDKKGGLERSRRKGEAARGRGKARREGRQKSRADARDTGATLLTGMEKEQKATKGAKINGGRRRKLKDRDKMEKG